MTPVKALTDFFVNVRAIKLGDDEAALGLREEIDKLAAALNIDPTADADTLEMGIREALK